MKTATPSLQLLRPAARRHRALRDEQCNCGPWCRRLPAEQPSGSAAGWATVTRSVSVSRVSPAPPPTGRGANCLPSARSPGAPAARSPCCHPAAPAVSSRLPSSGGPALTMSPGLPASPPLRVEPRACTAAGPGRAARTRTSHPFSHRLAAG